MADYVPDETETTRRLAMTELRRYLHGWYMWGRCLWLVRTKRRGAGPMPWRLAWRCAASYRWIVDGQHRNGRYPRWLRQSR